MGGKEADNNDKAHPYGTTLLSRDNKENRALFPKQTEFGHIPVAETVCTADGKCPYYHYMDDSTTLDNDTKTYNGNALAKETPIHILIAAYRDRLCGRTIHNAFMRASNPKRIFLRIIDQTERNSDLLDDAGCWETYCHDYNPNCEEEYKSQVQVVSIDAKLSKGPTFARSKLSAMVHWDYIHRDEGPAILDFQPVQKHDFCMQIDSHMDFSDHYDLGLIAMFHRTQNDYAVLSTYVADISQNNQDPKMVPNLCMVHFTGSIRNWGTKECHKLVKPKLTNAMWGAGLSFHRCHAELAVPVDPYLDNVFDGEEGSRGIRFFTHGYDVYTPDKVLVTHDYHTHQGNPVVHTWGRGRREEEHHNDSNTLNWKWNADIEEARSQWHTFGTKRVNMLLGIGSNFDSTEREKQEVEHIRSSRFGLGTKRTLEQAIQFTGINLLEEKMEENKCGNLIWEPYEETPNYGIVEEVLARSYGTEPATQPKLPILTKTIQQQNLRALAPSSPMNSSSSSSSSIIAGDMDMKVIALLAVLGLLIMKVISMGWRKKDERHKR